MFVYTLIVKVNLNYSAGRMRTSVILGELTKELKRIGRPVQREELSYLPFFPSVADNILAVKLDQKEQYILIIAKQTIHDIVLNDVHAEIMDESDLMALLYMIRQIH